MRVVVRWAILILLRGRRPILLTAGQLRAEYREAADGLVSANGFAGNFRGGKCGAL